MKKGTSLPSPMVSAELKVRLHGLSTGSGPYDLTVGVPVNAQGDLENVRTLLADVARYSGPLRIEVILVVNNYPEGQPPEELDRLEDLGARVVGVPNVRRPGEAVGFSARIPAVRAAATEFVVLFDADCRIPDPTALLDWYADQKRAGAEAAYTRVSYYDYPDTWSVRFHLGLHHASRWFKRTILGIPTTRGSNYAVRRDTMLSLYDEGMLADEMNVGPTFKRLRGEVTYSGRPELAVYTSGRMFLPGWRRLIPYFIYRLRYNLRVLPVREDVARHTGREKDPVRRYVGNRPIRDPADRPPADGSRAETDGLDQ